MSSASMTSTLSRPSIEILRARGDACPRYGGYRVVSNASVSSSSSTQTLNIPEDLMSRETFVWFGLKDDVAQRLFERLQETETEFPGSLNPFDVMKYRIQGISGNATANQPYGPILDRIGFTPAAISRLTGPWLFEWTETYSAKDIALMAIDSSWLFLSTLDTRITATRDLPDTATISTLSASSLLDLGNTLAGGSTATNWVSGPTLKHTLETVVQKKARASGYLLGAGPFVATASEPPPPPQMDGHTILLKGGCWERLSSAFREGEGPNFLPILSSPPGDFSKTSRDLYCTTSFDLALKYARMRKNCHGDVRDKPEVGILTVAVPNELLAGSCWMYGDSWRDFVWNCRNDNEQVDESFNHVKQHLWVCGPVCVEGTDRIMSGRIVKTNLKPFRLLNGNVPDQYMGKGEAVPKLLNEHCIGKVWLTALDVKKN